eukprot:15348714-Ditylum_brightwellii.AAC.1
MRANAAFTDCDARACYNRMIAIVTGLALHKAGLPIKMSLLLIKALKQMRYYMNTAYGVSTETNQHSIKSPAHGSGQRATDAPSGWGFTLHLCLVQYNKKAYKWKICDPTEAILQVRNADMFVDDMTAQHNRWQFNLDEIKLIEITHHDINLWDTTLNIAGGLLESQKSGYSLMIWTFDLNGTPHLKKEEDMQQNTVYLTRNGQQTPLQQYKETEGMKMLGVHKALNLQERSVIQYLKGTTHHFTKAINSCPIPRTEVTSAYNNTIQ